MANEFNIQRRESRKCEHKAWYFSGRFAIPIVVHNGDDFSFHTLEKEKFGYELDRCISINHQFFMDDLKLYGKSERELIELMRVFSDDIGMHFGFEKCAMLSFKSGIRVKSEGITVPSGESGG